MQNNNTDKKEVSKCCGVKIWECKTGAFGSGKDINHCSKCYKIIPAPIKEVCICENPHIESNMCKPYCSKCDKLFIPAPIEEGKECYNCNSAQYTYIDKNSKLCKDCSPAPITVNVREWEKKLEDFKFYEYSHSENDQQNCHSLYKECSVCHISSDCGASRKDCRHPWKKYKWGKCNCGADEKWNELKDFIKSLLSQQDKEWKEKVARIDEMKIKDSKLTTHEQTWYKNAGYNQAIDDIINILNTPNNE